MQFIADVPKTRDKEYLAAVAKIPFTGKTIRSECKLVTV